MVERDDVLFMEWDFAFIQVMTILNINGILIEPGTSV